MTETTILPTQAEKTLEAKIERVARAIAETQNFAWGLNYDTCLEEDREHCREIARAAMIAADELV